MPDRLMDSATMLLFCLSLTSAGSAGSAGSAAAHIINICRLSRKNNPAVFLQFNGTNQNTKY